MMRQEKFRVYQRYRSIFGFGEYWLMTPRELLERVRSDSKWSNYGWITSAAELVRTCSSPTFPADIAAQIRDLILGCFANLMEPGQTQEDQMAVFACYYNSKNEKLRKKFIRRLILGAMFQVCGDELTRAFCSSREIEEEFTEQKLQEFYMKESEGLTWPTYIAWYYSLVADFNAALDKAADEVLTKNPDFFFTVNNDI